MPLKDRKRTAAWEALQFCKKFFPWRVLKAAGEKKEQPNADHRKAARS
jgi:hypothetical protein